MGWATAWSFDRLRLWLETRVASPLPSDQTRVWSLLPQALPLSITATPP